MSDPTTPASPPAEPPQAPTPPAAAQPTPAAAQPSPTAAAQPPQLVDSKAARRTREVVAAKARGLNDRDLLAWMQSEVGNAESELDADTLVAEAARIADKTAHPDE